MFISAYLNLFDDWDILRPALLSVIDRVDEIIVVDGAYRWMLPYFESTGRDPTRSVEQVYDVLATLGPKIRVVNGIWENEIAKRIAGFEACKGKFRYRVDADEIFLFDEAATEAFLRSDCPVGQMDMPLYVAPGWINGVAGQTMPRQAFLFDSDKISAVEHLSYLWLVMPESERTYGPPKPNLIFRESLAFNVHLTHWRPPSSSLSRARFYVMNYMREHGMSGADFSSLFKRIAPKDFDEMLFGKSLVVMPTFDTINCIKTPLTAQQEQSFLHLYDVFLKSLADKNARLTNQFCAIGRGEQYFLDATSSESLYNLCYNGELTLEFSTKVTNIKLQLLSFYTDGLKNKSVEVDRTIDNHFVRIKLPPEDQDEQLLRRVFVICVWGEDERNVTRFKIHKTQTIE